MYVRTTLPNGLRILTAPMPAVRSVSLTFFFGVGSRYESEALGGVSHLIEHMLFKGSAHYPTAQAISEAIEGVGGVLDAATDKEMTVYSAKVASRHFDLALGLLCDMLRAPIMDPAELDKERRVIIEELSMYRDSPQDWISVIADETLWPGLPLGREVAGTRETVQSISHAAMEDYRAHHYAPNNLVVSIAGDITHERVIAALTELLGDWPAHDIAGWVPCPPPAGVPRVRLERRPTEQSNISLLLPGLTHTDPDYYTMVLLNAVLGDGMSSRLFAEVRERQGLAYDVGTTQAQYHDTGSFGVYAGVEPGRAPDALAAVLAELRRMRDAPITPDELTRAKEYSKGRMELRLEDSQSVASWLGGQELVLNTIHELDEVMAALDRVTAEDIQRLARALFREEWLRLAVIGPHGDATAFERLLRL